MNTTEMHDELAFAPAHELAELLGQRQITATDLLAVYLARIERLDQTLHAFISMHEQRAASAARAADERRASGEIRSQFDGLPIALKDLLDIDGTVTTGGSKYFENRVSTCTATLVSTLEHAGVYGMGKTHTVEFAMGGWGTNERLGTPRNPWDNEQHRAPGGSSAGSGVAVAAGLAPWAIGTDTGGSVRLPSAWCGLTGLKTTTGRISTYGIMPLSTTLDTPGPMCRCVEDAAHLFMLLQAADERDLRTKQVPPADVISTLRDGLSGIRLARLPDKELEHVEEAVGTAYEESLRVLERLGARVSERALPFALDDMVEMTMRIIAAEGYSFYGELIDNPSLPLDGDVRPRLAPGRHLLAKDYLLALRDRDAAIRAFNESFNDTDALLTPTIATTAPIVHDIDQSGTPARFTRPANLLDGCALSLPNGANDNGMPTSLQIMCKGFDEAVALRIGWAFQQEGDWHKRRPAGM